MMYRAVAVRLPAAPRPAACTPPQPAPPQLRVAHPICEAAARQRAAPRPPWRGYPHRRHPSWRGYPHIRYPRRPWAWQVIDARYYDCLLYTSDAADDM
eukprot:4716998-Prymnesium_polylepis.1